jgi:uncharacterized membrane protein YphA (DoxX/SURF4 family)
MVGYWTRLAAVATWSLTLFFASANPNITNAGDTIRGIGLFYLMLCPCGAIWSVDRVRQASLPCQTGVMAGKDARPTHVWPWPLRLLFIQLCVIYFMSGLYKLTGGDWVRGESLRYILSDLTLTRFSMAMLPIPQGVLQLLTWSVVTWELAFPALVLFRRTRRPALCAGVAFHLGIFALLELGSFSLHVLCLYLPLLPWENRAIAQENH